MMCDRAQLENKVDKKLPSMCAGVLAASLMNMSGLEPSTLPEAFSVEERVHCEV